MKNQLRQHLKFSFKNKLRLFKAKNKFGFCGNGVWIDKNVEIQRFPKNISIKDVEEEMKEVTYKFFKEKVSEAIIEELSLLQEKYDNIDDNDINRMLEKNNNYVQDIASKTMVEVKEKMGF